MNKQTRRSHTVMALIAGIVVPVNVSALKSDQFDMHHGKTPGGKQINSLGSKDIGDKTFVRKASGQMHDYDTDEFDLMSAQRLQAKGYTITPPNSTGTATTS